MAVKAQAVADFVAEFTGVPRPAPECSEETVDTTEVDDQTTPGRSNERWKLFVDGSSNSGGSEVGLVLVSPYQYKTNHALHFNLRRLTIKRSTK